MAALGFDGAIFASDVEELDQNDLKLAAYNDMEAYNDVLSKKKGSLLYYFAFPGNHHLNNINESFRVQLLHHEGVEVLAVGKGFIAVATTKNLLRIYNAVGLEVSVTYLKGKVAALSAHDKYLAIIYHSNSAVPINQIHNLNLDLYEINWQQGCKGQLILSSFPIPLHTPKNQLEWIGWDSDNHFLSILDSQGMLSQLLYSTMDWQFVPVLNIKEVRKTIDHKYWPIMIKSSKLVYVLLNV
jgi:chromosome transmission fidelity protein 4